MKAAAATLFCLLTASASAWAQAPQSDSNSLEQPQILLSAGSIRQAQDKLSALSSSDDLDSRLMGLCGQAQIIIESNQASAQELEAAVGMLDNAAQILAEANETSSGWCVIVPYLQAKASVKRGDRSAAKTQIERAQEVLKSYPSVTDLKWYGAVPYEASFIFEDDNRRARDAAESAIAWYGAFEDFPMIHEQAHAEERLGDLEAARKKMRRALSNYESALTKYEKSEHYACQASLLLRLALQYAQNGEYKPARRWLERAEKAMDAAKQPADLISKRDQVRSLLPAE